MIVYCECVSSYINFISFFNLNLVLYVGLCLIFQVILSAFLFEGPARPFAE